jgi:hypothetical protein
VWWWRHEMELGAVWTALVEVAVVGGLVLYEAGIAAIPGVVIIFLTQPLQVRHHFVFWYIFFFDWFLAKLT